MDIFFAPIQPFITHPVRIALVAIFFFIGSIYSFAAQRHAWLTIATGVGWALYAVWEWYCNNQGYDIRVDLFVIVPVLYTLTAYGLFSIFRRKNIESNTCEDS